MPKPHHSPIPTPSGSRSRRKFALLALLATLGSGLLAACQSPSQGPGSEAAAVRIGYSAWPGWFPWAVT
ncbi:MAG: hypothetical protein ACKO1V_00320, partial [Cyanobium sp.]